MSRNGNTLRSFPRLCEALAAAVPGPAALDGEIVYLGADGTPQFYELMRRKSPQHFAAFDLLWHDGSDLRGLPLRERKRLLRRRVPPQPSQVLYVDHVVAAVTRLYAAACQRDLEGNVAKLATGVYTPEATTWVKVRILLAAKRKGG